MLYSWRPRTISYGFSLWKDIQKVWAEFSKFVTFRYGMGRRYFCGLSIAWGSGFGVGLHGVV